MEKTALMELALGAALLLGVIVVGIVKVRTDVKK